MYDAHIRTLSFDTNWLSVVELSYDNKINIVFNIYLPYECADNHDNFIAKLGVLTLILYNID